MLNGFRRSRLEAKVTPNVCRVWLCVVCLILVGCERGPLSGLLPPGSTPPPLEAEGWLQGAPPSWEDLRGRVVVLEAWAHWCGPCRLAAQHLVGLHEKYRGQEVSFIGLTGDGGSQLEPIRRFLSELRIPWVTGYGAAGTLRRLGVSAIPVVFVFDRQGRVLWHNGLGGYPEDAIERALRY